MVRSRSPLVQQNRFEKGKWKIVSSISTGQTRVPQKLVACYIVLHVYIRLFGTIHGIRNQI